MKEKMIVGSVVFFFVIGLGTIFSPKKEYERPTVSFQEPVKPIIVEAKDLAPKAELTSSDFKENTVLLASRVTQVTEPEKFVMPLVTLRPHKLVDLSFLTPGKIESVEVVAGQAVSEGTVLVHMEKQDVEAKLRENKAKLASAIFDSQDKSKIDAAIVDVKYYESELETYYRLYEKYAASRGEVAARKRLFIQSENALNAANFQIKSLINKFPVIEAEIEGALAELDKRKITAPFEGQVGEIVTEVGQVVDKEKILTFYDLSKVKAICAVPIRDLKKYSWWKASLTPIIEVQTETGPVRVSGKMEYNNDVVEGNDATFHFIFENSRTNYGWLITPTSRYIVFYENPAEGKLEEIAYSK